MIRILPLLVLLSSVSIAFAQNTVGLLSYNPTQAYDGYNLLYPHNQPNVYLVDNCGEVVHSWEDEDNWRPANTAYLTEEGLLYKSKRDAVVVNDPIWAGGGGAILEIRDWDNNLIWDFELNDSINRLHHDFAVTEAGTIIAVAWELKDTEACIAAGRDTSTLDNRKQMWPDWVFEIDPAIDEIIWEWHAWDHLVQDFDSTRANFGDVTNPHKIDVNFGREDGHPDWLHANALDYNEDLDQIMLSIPYFDEIWIIDHSTTTEEASTGFGGFSNRGGDLMFRWGNPETFGQTAQQTSFFQHDAHWVDDFLTQSHPDFGKIAFFNNQIGVDFSVANVITSGFDMYTWSYEMAGDNTFLPMDYDQTFTHPEDPTRLWSTGLSSVQILPNRNTLITSGRFGYSFELTPDNEIVWEYVTPRVGTNPATQGDSLTINQNLTFRVQRYPADFAAFAGRDLTGNGWLELEPNIDFCDQILPTVEIMDEAAFMIYPNPTSDKLIVEWDGMMKADITIHNLMGETLASFPQQSGGRSFLDVAPLGQGLFLITINGHHSRKFFVR